MTTVNPLKRHGQAKKIDSAKQTQVTVSGGKFKKLTVDVDPELYKKFSHYVIDNGTSITGAINQFISDCVNGNPPTRRS